VNNDSDDVSITFMSLPSLEKAGQGQRNKSSAAKRQRKCEIENEEKIGATKEFGGVFRGTSVFCFLKLFYKSYGCALNM
jgi:hypothetical protein